MEVLICKQPIFNRLDEVVSYELFYRNKQFNAFTSDTSQATIEVLVNVFLSFGAERITHNKRFFTRFPQSLIMSDFLDTFEHEQLIIELEDDLDVNETFIDRICELKTYGLQISIDSTILNQNSTILKQLLQYMDYCSVDLDQYSLPEQVVFEEELRRLNPHIRLLARNVHSRAVLEDIKHRGYVLFQGSYFMEPETISTNDIPSLLTNYFELLSLFQEEDPSIGEIAEIIEQDVSLSYKILQLANNASNQLNINITSIRQAIMLLGLLDVQKWIYLLAMHENRQQQTDIERELLRSSLLRAKICEQLARNKLFNNYAEFFMVGMFSNIDSMLGRPMTFIMNQLPFSPVIKQTLLEQNTEITPFLELAICLDRLQFDKIYEGSIAVGIPLEQVELIYSNTSSWVDSIFESMDEFNNSSYSY